MDVKKEIFSSILTNENNGALLLTGKWGCGKTFLLRNVSEKLNKENKYAVVCVSLFGVDSVDALNRKVKESIFSIMFTPKLTDSGAKKVSKIKNTVNGLASALSDYSSIAKGINAALSVNLYDLIEIEQYIKCKQEAESIKKELVLLFDDFERSQLGIVELLGAINEYTENRHIKTIIVADEEIVMQNDTAKEYSVYKEKLISRTLKLIPQYDEIIESIIINYRETVDGYRIFLQENMNVLVCLFCESESENIRTLKSLFMDFERVFTAWKKTDIPKEFMPDILYSFGAVIFEFKAGNYEKGKYAYLFSDSNIKTKYSLFNRNKSNLSSLRVWVTDGLWSEENFQSELKHKFCPELLTSEQRFFMYGFWDLQQEDIDIGFPFAVEKAYKGELCRDELVTLLQTTYALNRYGIELPCEIDYKQIELGLETRKSKIITGDVIEPEKRTFTEDRQIDTEAVSLNHEIESVDEFLYALDNRNKYITYLQNQGNSSRYDIKGLNISSFDEELLVLFFETYQLSDNSSKRDVALSLIQLNFLDSSYSGTNEIM